MADSPRANAFDNRQSAIDNPPVPDFVCETCGDRFSLSPSVLQKFPNWTPKACMKCRESAGAKKSASPKPAAAPRVRAGNSASRELNMTTTEVLLRYHRGPVTGVFTDGSCAGNPGPGGWGAVKVRDGKVIAERHGSHPATTNNRMELTAMIEGLKMVEPGEVIDVYSDSDLVVKTLTLWAKGWEARGWKRKEGEVKNLELVQEAYALANARPGARIQWIRAHDGSRWNEYADSLSTAYQRTEV